MLKKIADIGFILLTAALLCFGMVRSFVAPEDINEYENRTAEKIGELSAESYGSGEFQDSVEAAAGDQIYHAIVAKERYNTSFAELSNGIFTKILAKESAKQTAAEPAEQHELPEAKPDEETPEQKAAKELLASLKAEGGEAEAVGDDEPVPQETVTHVIPQIFKLSSDLYLENDHLSYPPRRLQNQKDGFDKFAAKINSLAEQYPELDFYMFYIEKETDIDFSTGEKLGLYNYLADRVNLDLKHKQVFRVNYFEEFDDWFYKTDHHWNYKGSYRGYTQILHMLKPDATPLEPQGEILITENYRGSKATGSLAGSYKEPFYAYIFDYPELDTTICGSHCNYYGAEDFYNEKVEAEGLRKSVTYGMYYGEDDGEIIFKNPNSDGGNILVFGESYDNPVLRLLAADFTELCSVDLRHYKAEVGKSFNFGDYIAEHNIDTVLFCGNLDFYISSTFRNFN